jgi:hypothetical protein
VPQSLKFSDKTCQWTVPQGLGWFLTHICGLESKGRSILTVNWQLIYVCTWIF